MSAPHDPQLLSSANVVISGAGVAGYLAAIILHRNGYRNITLIDRLENPAQIHRTRAYSLVIYKLGQRLLHELPDLFEIFKQHAYEQTTRKATTYSAQGQPSTAVSSIPASPVYWLLRANFIKFLAEYVSTNCPSVNVLTDSSVEDFVFEHTLTAVKIRSGSNTVSSVPADLVIACDGSNSTVRHIARKHENTIESSRGFRMFRRSSPSVGMCPKGILLSAKPIIKQSDGTLKTLDEATTVYNLKGNKSCKHRFNLLLLPLGKFGDNHGRIGMVCLPKKHQLWDTHSVERAFEMFEENFPNLNVRDIISVPEMEHLISEKPLPFCEIERPQSIVGVFKQRKQTTAAKGILFLGDAAHSFPPDIAQGINSTLEDVRVFKGVLEEFGGDRASLPTVLKKYEERRDKEIWDLMRLSQDGNVYQYEQDRLGLLFYNVNKSIRSRLCAMAPGLFHPVVDVLVRQDYDYGEVRKLARQSATNTIAVACSLALVPICAVLFSRGMQNQD